jgi:RHS repeat-associated protein
MKLTLLKSTFSLLLLAASLGLGAQTVTGPSPICSGALNTYNFNYTGTLGGTVKSIWGIDPGGSLSGVGVNTKTISASFTSSGNIYVNLYNQITDPEHVPKTYWNLVATYTLPVTVKTPGTLRPLGTSCPGTITLYTNLDQLGSSFSWQSSPMGQNLWSTFATTGVVSSVSAPLPSQTTDFRIVLDECGVASPSITVNVQTPPTAGTIAGNATICYGSSSPTLATTINPTPSSTWVQWQQRVNNGSWTNIPGSAGWSWYSYSPGVIAQTTDYRMISQWGCDSNFGAPSNFVTVTVNPTSQGGTLSSTNGATFCNSGTINLSLSGYTGSVIGWYYQYNDGGGWSSWTQFSTANSSTNSFGIATNGSINRSYQFYAQVQSGVCTAANSNTLGPITVYSSITGTLSPTISESFAPVNANFTLSGYAPAASLLWQQSPDGVSWSSASGPNNSATYTGTSSAPGVLISTSTKYRVQVANGSCLGYSAVLPVIISQPPSINCAINPAFIAVGNSVLLTASSNNGSSYNSYQWIKSGVDIPGATTSSYTATEPSTYTLRVTSSPTSPTATSPVFAVYEVGLQPDNSVNAIVTTVVRTAGVNPNTDLYTLPNGSTSQSVQYLDIQSRPIQTVVIGQSPLQKDIVQPYTYDTLTSTSYLPYVATTKDGSRRITAINNGGYTSSDQYLFYQNTSSKVANSTSPFARTTYESSPLGRVVEQGAPGTDWQPGAHTVKPVFHTSNTTFKVRTWTTTGPTGYYTNAALAVNRVTDENGNPVMTYSDKLGRTILKRVKTSAMPDSTTWLETYYVYDTRGNLAMQVPPKVTSMLNNGTAWSTTLRDMWCFVYKYNVRNNIEQKQVPGAAVVYYVYDTLGRLVLTQDGNLRATNQWAFVKYDIKGRSVMSGVYTNATQTTLSGIKGIVKVLYPNNSSPWYEERGTALHGYTNQSFPTTNSDGSALQILSVNYFDNYDFDYNGAADFSYTAQGMAGEGSQGNSFGLATGSKRLILNSSSWLYSYVFYDRFGRTIQTRSNNHLSLTIDNLSTIAYDFEGKVLQTKTYHNAGGTNQTTVVQTPSYDVAGRLLQIAHSTNGAQSMVVAQYNYNELGQVVRKDLHCTNCADPAIGQPNTVSAGTLQRSTYSSSEQNLLATQNITLSSGYFVPNGSVMDARIIGANASIPPGGGQFMQSVDYRYNIRGWLTSINNAQLVNDGGTTNSDTNDYFGMELFYNNSETSSLGNTPSYNGNISAVKWKNGGVANGIADQRSYKYNYDNSDKLKAATFQANTGSGWAKETNTLNEVMSYDHNGNILNLTRNQNQRGLSGATVTSAAQGIDNLTYTYASGNQLSKVDDASASATGFNDGSTQTTEYTYNTNGNLSADQNKGISSIIYNVLGKAQQINFTNGNTVAYTYDAAGTKLTMASTVSGTTTTTNYVGGFVYNTNAGTSSLNFFSSPEGRVVKNGSNFEYQYAITDHQGNTRVVFTSAAQTGVSSLANFEGDANDQPTQFTNYGHISGVNNHTPGGTNSQYLNGGYAGVVGVGKSYKVFPGDKLQIEAYGSYNAPSSNSSSIVNFTSILLGAFNLPTPAPGEVGTPSAGLNAWGGANAAMGYGDGSTDNTDPKAFVNIIIFDKNYNFLDVAYAQLKGTSLYYMSQTYTVKEAGYAYLYVSNEQVNMTDVYFDDVKMTYTPGNILQSNEYYPFGLQTANSWTRDNTTNNFLANGGTEMNTTSSLYDLEFRNFDPILGRMNQVDPMSDMYGNHTPYNYAFNNPVSINDPNGADPWDTGSDNVIHMLWPGGRSPYINYHYDAEHEDPGIYYYSNSVGSDMFGDIPFGSGEAGQMQADAQAVRDGRMSVSDYATLYGQNIYSASSVSNSITSYGAGQFNFNYGGKTYAGEYFTLGGKVVGASVSESTASEGGFAEVAGGNRMTFDFLQFNQQNVNQADNILRSSSVGVSFENGANNQINPKLAAYFSTIMGKASRQGINSVKISSTTNHPSNSKNSAHSLTNGARAFDINYINGVAVTDANPLSKILQTIIQTTPGWLENYGPDIIEKMHNGASVQAPWAREIPGGHYDHIHVSVPK